jgi:effector-binding domain-containing protein
MSMDFGYNPFGRLMGLMMDKWLGADFEKGLQELKKVSEATPQKEMIAGFEAEMRDMPEITVMGIRYVLPPAKVQSDVFAKSFERIAAIMAAQNLEPDGMPMALYYKLSNTELDFEAAMPVKITGKNVRDIQFHNLAASRALVVNYRGAYDAMTPVYQAMYDYLKEKGLKQAGPSREVYITDPIEVPDTARWLTEIVIPVE